MFRQRVRVCYSVGGDKRFLSHHDMMRLWLRALRRSGLPLRMTEGFHVRPRVSFAMARGVGIASESEWLGLELADWVNPDVAHKRLASQLPPDIAIRSLETVAPSDRAVVRRIVYTVTPDRVPQDIDRRIRTLLDRRRVIVERGPEGKRRQVDIRPWLAGLQVRRNCLEVIADCRSDGTLKPEEVLAQLAFSPDEIARSLIVRRQSQLDPA